MKKLVEIFEIPELSFFIEPMELNFFIDSKNVAKVSEKIMESIENSNYFIIASDIDKIYDSSNYESITATNASIVKKVLLSLNSRVVSPELLLLFYGNLAQRYLHCLNNNISAEIVYLNGHIYTFNDGKIIPSKHANLTIPELKKSLAKGILIANKELKPLFSKYPNIEIVGEYLERGKSSNNKIHELKISKKNITDSLSSKELYDCFSADEIANLFSERYISKSNLLKAISLKNIEESKVLELMQKGILSSEEVLKKYYKSSSFKDVAHKDKTKAESKILLYSMGLADIQDIESTSEKISQRPKISSEYFKKVAHKFTPNMIGELLTHYVLTYDESITFLQTLEDEKIITHEQNSYFEKLMEDFKTNQLLNESTMESLPTNSEHKAIPTYKAGITIDPKLRMRYLESIGTVKRILVKGRRLLSDNSTSNKKNSIDGYELLILPDKRIAVLEKFYETTQDKSGKVVYRKNKDGLLIPAISNATYIIPIGLAKELTETKNKKDLLQLPYVRRCFHVGNWVEILQERMQNVNPDIEFDKANTDKWQLRISENYEKNRQKREDR